MAGFTDQQPRIATERDVAARWGGGKDGFRCYLCGHTFRVGDRWRWVHATHRGCINPLVCGECDGDDVLDRWIARVADAKQRFWWLWERE